MAVEVARLNEPDAYRLLQNPDKLDVSVVQLTSRSEPSIEPLAAAEGDNDYADQRRIGRVLIDDCRSRNLHCGDVHPRPQQYRGPLHLQVGFVSQSANFGELSGVFKFDEAAPEHSYLNAVIKTASLKANQFEDKLKGEDFFNVTAWPEIRFVSRDFRPAAGNRAELTGDLTMKGITKPITLHLAFNPAQAAIPSRGGATGGAQLIAESRILRSSFNMTALGFLVDDEIDIRFHAALQAKR